MRHSLTPIRLGKESEVLAGMWGSGVTCTLLVDMQIGPAPLENGWGI